MDPEPRVVYVDSAPQPAVGSAAEDAGFDVDTVETASDCLEVLPDADCVVLSDRLEERSVEDCCRTLRDRHPSLPIVVYATDGSERLAGAVVAAGADGYVPRSAGVDTLVDRVTERLETDRPAGADSSGDVSDRHSSLFAQSPLAIVEWDLDFRVRNWNPAATELLGYAPAEAIGTHASAFFPDETDEEIEAFCEQVVGDGSVARRVDRTGCKDGTTITCEWFHTPLTADRGGGETVVGVLSFCQDVTTDVKRATALEALQETTAELIRASSVDDIAEIVVDATDRVVDRSLAGLRFYDAEADALRIAATTPQLEVESGDLSTVGAGDGPLWDVYRAQEPAVIDDASTDMVPYDLAQPVGNAIIHPLGEHGVLTVASAGTESLDMVDYHLVHVLAATAEAALDRAARERELERAKTVIEAVGDSVYALDPDGRFVTANDTLAEMTGYDRDQLLGEHVSTVLTEESRQRGRDHIRSLLADDEDRITTYEVTAETVDGEPVPGEVNMTLLRSDGDFEGTVGIFRDVRDRKRMERELVERKAKIESLHEVASRLDDCQSPDAVCELAVEAAEQVLQFDVCVVDRIDGDYLEKVALSSNVGDADYVERLHVEEGIAGKTYRTGETYRYGDLADAADAAGETDKYQSLLSVPIGDHGVFQAVSRDRNAFDADDEELTELLISHVADTLDRLAFEAELREERDRFVALFENVPDAVVSVSNCADDPIVEEINPAFERIFGYDESQMLGQPLDQLIVPADRAEEAARLNERGSRGEIAEAAVKRRTSDGLRDFMLRVVPIEVDTRSDRAFALYTDITEQKQRQQRVEILNRVLRHDLRNGMNIVDGCARMLGESVGEENAEYVETIRERASELSDLAEKTRAVERTLDRDGGTTGPTDVAAAVQQAADRVASQYPGAEISCAITDDVYALTDEYFQTAIVQVLENAIEHNDAATPAVEIERCDSREEGMVALSIADNGPGIPDEERALLEEDREITQLRHASGLGLWLVNWVVTKSGGQLRFEENDPRGTIVTLELPRADPESDPTAVDDTATDE